MASLDTLLQNMSAQGVAGATLRGDAPIQLQGARGLQTLGVVANAQLEHDIREIAPADAQNQLATNAVAHFTYGGAQFTAYNTGGLWQLQIALPMAMASSGASSVWPNTSGQGANATIPPELRGWNWGGFFLSWIWGIGNNAWIGLLAFVPCIGFFMRFALGAKGNEWSWRNRRWNSVAEFQSAQKTWAIVGAILFVVSNLLVLPITAAIMFPVFARARENARRASCQQHLKQIGIGAIQYALAHGEHLPKGNTFAQWRPQIASYVGTVKEGNLYHCPSDKTLGDSYELNPKLSGVFLESISDPANTPMMWDKDSIEHLEGRNVLFADGHVKWYRDQTFKSQFAPVTH